jgi:hypothetical protein
MGVRPHEWGTMRAILAVLLTTMLAGFAFAQTPASVETELSVNKPCRIIDDDGEVGDYTLVRCPGLAGARVFTVASPAHVSLSFRWGKATAEKVVSGYSLGDKLEWRGIRSKQGFKPYAVVVRVIERDPNALTKEEGADKRYNVLAVLRIEPRNTCLMAAVDETENKGALALARAAVDVEAPAYVCETQKPKMLGTVSRWAQDVIGYEDDPPK